MATKRQRVDRVSLANVVHMRGVSGSALRRVVNILVPDTPVSKREVADVSYERFNRIKHTLHFPSVNGGEVSFDVCEPKAFLDLLLQENQVTRQWYEDAWQANPSTPFHPLEFAGGLG